MNTYRKKAYEMTKGVVEHLLFIVVVLWLFGVVVDFFEWCELDPTDQSCAQKSGLTYYKDYGTGKEYISSGRGGPLIER